MFRALWTSASGMTAQQTNLDVILKRDNTSGEKLPPYLRLPEKATSL